MRPLNKVDFICIHCADSKISMNVEVETLRRWHVEERGMSDIGYHYFIKFDGSLHNCRDRQYQGAHCRAINHNSIAICLEGGFNGENNFTQKQLQKLNNLIIALKREFPNAALVGHSHFDDKACPSFDVVAWFDNQQTPEPTGFI